MAPSRAWSPVWLAGVVILAHFLPAMQLDMTVIPSIAPYPALKPTDTGYPGNLPSNLPSALDSPPAILNKGPLTSCVATVGSVLTANGRTLLVQYLQSSSVGQQVLSGQMSATILAPPDAYLQQVLSAGVNNLKADVAPAYVAQYHILQGSVSMATLARSSGYYWNTTMAKPPCSSAYQAITTQTAPVDINGAGPVTFVKSATQTARITQGDIQACNSVVHLLDHALQPCCTSMYKFLGEFSIVQIQPSYFNGYAALEPVQSTDSFNRRLVEEAAIDFLLYAKLGNNSKSVLWPAPTAWGNVQLAALLPGYSSIDVTTRTNAMRILALYAMSYTQSLLPKDIPAADGSAPSIVFPYLTALSNATAAASVWPCSDTLTVVAPAVPASGAPVPTTPVVTPTTSITPAVSPSPSPTPSPSPSPRPSPSPSPNPVIAQQPAVQPQVGRKRSLLSAATGNSKTVNIQTVYESCEGTRILIVDAVAVPCNFESLVRNYASINQTLASVSKPARLTTLEEAYHDWLLQQGLIQQGQPISSYKSPTSGAAVSGVQRPVVLLVCLVVMSWFMLC